MHDGKIASFTVDHLRLEPGVYLSRTDIDPDTKACVTTFDLRMTAPNCEPVINTAELHTIEHMGATFLRNDSQWASRVVYFGPMGCRTGYYLVVFGNYTSRDVLDLVIRLLSLSAIMRERFLVLRRQNAETTSIKTSRWRNSAPKST